MAGKIDKAVFNYKTLRLIMMAFGSLMIAVGSMYAYFIYTTVGSDDLGDALWPFLFAILAVPAGIFVCITGKKLKAPIMRDE